MARILQDVFNAASQNELLKKINTEILPVIRSIRRQLNLVNSEPTTVTTDTTLTTSDYSILVDASSNAVDVTLPSLTDATTNADLDVIGITYRIKSIDSTNAVTIVGTIDGAANKTLATNKGVILQSNEDGWWVIADV